MRTRYSWWKYVFELLLQKFHKKTLYTNTCIRTRITYLHARMTTVQVKKKKHKRVDWHWFVLASLYNCCKNVGTSYLPTINTLNHSLQFAFIFICRGQHLNRSKSLYYYAFSSTNNAFVTASFRTTIRAPFKT